MELDENGLPCLAQFSEEGFVDCVFKVENLVRAAGHYHFDLRGSFEGQSVGLAVRLPALPATAVQTLRSKCSLLADARVLTLLAVSLLAAVSSLGMYTFIAPLLAEPGYGGVQNVTPYLWVWGLGGVAGSFLVGPLAERVRGPQLTLAIMLVLAGSLLTLPLAAAVSPWLAMLPIALWGAVGWALQVPQNNQLISARERQGDGNLAVALNESALYLGSAVGAAAGGVVLLMQWPGWALPISAGAVALLGAALQRRGHARQDCAGQGLSLPAG